MLHTTSTCTVKPLYIVVLTSKGTVCLSTSSQFRTPLWLQSPMTSWHVWVPLTEELLPRYITARSHHIDILRKLLWYSPVATTLPIYYCTLETITMTCHYEHIFLVKSWYRNVKSVLLTGRSCLHAGLNHTAPIKRHNKTLTKVTDNNLKIPINISPTYDR